MMQRILVTGAAGFIGFHTTKRLLALGYEVTGIDNMNAYYDPALKEARLAELQNGSRFDFQRIDLSDRGAMEKLFTDGKFDAVINLAAQAGVRYSIKEPHAYVESNLVGFLNVLEGCRHTKVKHLVFASSSSVYGANTKIPFSEHDTVDHPMSLYAATKKSNELMAHSYANLYKLPVSGLRFFTVYGPWGRPDMAMHLFTKALFDGTPIDIFNQGKMRRDFTYVDDIVEGIVRVMEHVAVPNPEWSGQAPDPATSFAPYRLYNIGNHQPCELMDLISTLEDVTGKKAEKRFLEMQPGDVLETYADTDILRAAVGFAPTTSLRHGVEKFVKWYRDYYKV